eukprot:scaffold5315_cov101-Skeletonema_marinoi.AAC.3
MYCGAEALIISGIRKSSVQPMIIAMMISAVNVMEITWLVSVHLSADADGFSFSVDAVFDTASSSLKDFREVVPPPKNPENLGFILLRSDIIV